MFRNQYDHDVTVWSPQGRIHQIEYAMEAVKQGSAAIALKNQQYAVIVALKRAPSELSAYQEKIITIDDHVGVAIAGLTADGRLLSRLMRRECADNRWAYDEPLPVSRLLSTISLKMQIPTQRYGNRPYGAGMLVTGYDALGPHVYYLCPSSNAYDCKCIAIGSRSQSARTYLERHLEEIAGSSLNELICHGLNALNGTLPNEVEITTKNCSVAIVGKDRDFTIYEDDRVEEFLKMFEASQKEEQPATSDAGAVPTPMEQDQPAYATSTQLYNWYFTPTDVAAQRQESNAAARKRIIQTAALKQDPDIYETNEDRVIALDPDEESNIVKRYIYLMRALCEKFTNPRLPDEVFGFAVTYLKRFYLHHSVMDFYPREMMLTCLYMACKAADFPVGIQTFTSHIPRNQERYSYFILNSELFLLEALGYDLWVFTPYRPLTGLIMDLVAYQKRLRKNSSGTQVSLNEVELVNELRKEGTELINLWYQTDLCLTVHPSQFALAILVELGRTRPQLDVEVFVRDELCGCDPMQKPKKLSVSSSNGQDTEEEDEDEDDDNSDDENAAKINSKGSVNKQEEVKKRSSSPQPKPQKNDHIPPEERWKQLSERLDHIRAVVNEFDFVYNLQRITEEETKLEACRNPLYDLDSDEYKEAKSKADSLLANLE